MYEDIGVKLEDKFLHWKKWRHQGEQGAVTAGWFAGRRGRFGTNHLSQYTEPAACPLDNGLVGEAAYSLHKLLGGILVAGPGVCVKTQGLWRGAKGGPQK